MPLTRDLPFVFLLKTYSGDAEYVDRLLESFHLHNVERLPLVISCPRGDRCHFDRYASELIWVMSDEDVTDELVDAPVAGIRPGYVNQEIIKLAFGETGIAHNYMCLDSDGVFIRDFSIRDFMFDSETPFTVMFEDNELRTDLDYFNTHWRARSLSLDKIREAVGLPPQPIITCHGFAILSSKVIRSLRTDFMQPRGLSFADLLAISPFEFSWYTLYLQANRTIDIHQRESLFRYVHTPQQYTLLSLSGVTVDDMSRGYIGLTINSNFSRDLGLAELGAPMEEVLGRYVSFRTLGRAVLVRVGLAVRIVLERLVSRGR